VNYNKEKTERERKKESINYVIVNSKINTEIIEKLKENKK